MSKVKLYGGVDGHIDHVSFEWEGDDIQEGLKEFLGVCDQLVAEYWNLNIRVGDYILRIGSIREASDEV